MIRLPGLPPPLYWTLRLGRKFTPRFAIDWMMDNEVFLRPGQDTQNPAGAADLYADAAAPHQACFAGASILIMGFGGGYGVALELLERGAEHVALQDPYAPLRVQRNDRLDPERMSRHFRRTGDGHWQPNPERVSVVREHLPEYAARNEGRFEMVLSNSVLEHIQTEEVPEHISASARLCKPGGLSIHHIDLRDHVFRYTFEMPITRSRPLVTKLSKNTTLLLRRSGQRRAGCCQTTFARNSMSI
jgi:hypothetical protein